MLYGGDLGLQDHGLGCGNKAGGGSWVCRQQIKGEYAGCTATTITVSLVCRCCRNCKLQKQGGRCGYCNAPGKRKGGQWQQKKKGKGPVLVISCGSTKKGVGWGGVGWGGVAGGWWLGEVDDGRN